MVYPTLLEREVAARFPRDVAGHRLTVMHDEGLYRHLRLAHPERSAYWYDVVSWPGALAVVGDMGGGYVFRRTTDMFGFFRRNGNTLRVNPDYWSEKLPDGRRSVREYSREALDEQLAEAIAEYTRGGHQRRSAAYVMARAEYDRLDEFQRWPYTSVKEPVKPRTPDEVRVLVRDADQYGHLDDEGGARRLLADLETDPVVTDTWEWDLAGWSRPFLWFCHGIVWAIAQYDQRARGPVQATEGVAA